MTNGGNIPAVFAEIFKAYGWLPGTVKGETTEENNDKDKEND